MVTKEVKVGERPNTFGAFLKRERETRTTLTQHDVGERSNGMFDRNYVASIEQGYLLAPPPGRFNMLKRIIGFSGWEGLTRIGYDVESPDMVASINPTLLKELVTLTDAQQSQVLENVRTLRKFS